MITKKLNGVTVGSGTQLEFVGQGYKTTDDGSNTKFDFTQLVQYATVTITNTQLKALRATPKTLVAAPGAGKYLEFVSATLKLHAGANVLSESTANMTVKLVDGSGAAVSQAIESTGFIDQAANTLTSALPKIDAIVAGTAGENKALVLHNIGAGEFGGNAANDATLVVGVAYRVHTL